MNRKLTLILILLITTTSAKLTAQNGAQFDNSSFENWTTRETTAANEPVHWHSSGTSTGLFGGFLSNQIEPSDQVRPGSNGMKSVRIFPTSILGVTANGTFTNGRMNAGSMSTIGSENYNYTQRAESAFNTPINAVPDSIAIWVCFRSESSTQRAQLRCVVHGDADYKFVANGTEEPAEMLVASARHTFTRTSTANGAYIWRRLSVPFVKDGPCNDPRYILFTITTNEVPGEGSDNDDLFVDDVELIYNPDGIEENEDICFLSPNPFYGQLNLKAQECIQNVFIYDQQGRCVRSLTASSNELSLDLGDLPSGLYLIRMNAGKNTIAKPVLKL
jgi:hypothetical protein